MQRTLKNAGWVILVAICIVVAAEITSRVEDFLRSGISVLASPDFDSALFTTIQGERQGKPGGRFGSISLNNLGFRGPEIAENSGEETVRVLVLGSSETFGVFESQGKEYPSQLRHALNRNGKFEVINAALPGMTPQAAIRAFDRRLSQLSPDIVVVYFSPLFELNNPPPSTAHRNSLENRAKFESPTRNLTAAGQTGYQFRSRFLQRLKDSIEKPDFIQRAVDLAAIKRQRNRLEPDGIYSSIPMEYVEKYIGELDAIVSRVRDSKAVPIVMTHAIKSKSPPTGRDQRTLEAFLVNTPRATPQLLLDYEHCVQQRVLEYSMENRVQCIDLAGAINGDSESFGDLVHFSNIGAQRVAKMIEEKILSLDLPTGMDQ